MEKRNYILIVDDNTSILENFKKILLPAYEDSEADLKILELENILFNEPGKTEKAVDKINAFVKPHYIIDTASQGEEAIKMVQRAEEQNIQYDLIFMDIKMPPGIDGIETISNIWRINPDIEVVICTAFTDYSWEHIISKLGVSEHLLFLKKPINPIEIKQTALSLINKRDADKEKKNLQNYLKNVIDSMPSIIISVNDNQQIIHWNIEAEKITGITPEMAFHKQLEEAFPSLIDEITIIKNVILSQEPMKKEKVLWKNGSTESFKDIIIYPLKNIKEKGAVIRIDDITNRVRMEEMMIQTEKMLSVGGLAAGMAHEINNPLANILQSIQLIDNRIFNNLPANEKTAIACNTSLEAIQKYMNERQIPLMLSAIRESGQRSAEIVRDMLSFSRKNGTGFVSVDICKLMDKTVEIASNDYLLKEKFDFKQIKIIREYANDIKPIMCEKNNIQLVLLNILKNGAHAMAGKAYNGIIPQFILRIKQTDLYIHIEIEDNGPGISNEIQKRIFEPFFTTKIVGSGIGLGLSVSYFIITKNHNGHLLLNSEPGVGAKFIIELPLSNS